MENERNLIHSAVWGILRKDGKVLLMRRFNTGYKDGFLTLPSGHIEPNELPKESMLRELAEETGVTCDINSIIPVHSMYGIFDTGKTYVNLYFEIIKYNGEPENKEPEKCDHMDWYDIENLPENTIPSVKIALNHIKNKAPISEIRE